MTSLSFFARRLVSWYRKNARQLPWRQTRDPYKIWISEVMLQQTTVNAVVPYYNKWIRRFPSVENVAKARLQTVLKMWQGLGYYQRARNLHRSAKIITRKYRGRIPQDKDDLKKLPGFGPYTAGAVLSIAFDMRHPIIDANIRRVVMRQLGIKGPCDARQDGKVLGFLDRVMPRKGLRNFNQALMELGALVCRSREPLCSLCPIRETCRAYDQGIQEIIPTPNKRKLIELEAAIAVIEQGRKFLIQQRPSKGLLAGLWEFPGGKVKKAETTQDALKREIAEELDSKLSSVRHWMDIHHFYTQYKVNLHVFRCRLTRPLPKTKTRKWVTVSELRQYPMPSGSAKIVDRLSDN